MTAGLAFVAASLRSSPSPPSGAGGSCATPRTTGGRVRVGRRHARATCDTSSAVAIRVRPARWSPSPAVAGWAEPLPPAAFQLPAFLGRAGAADSGWASRATSRPGDSPELPGPTSSASRAPLRSESVRSVVGGGVEQHHTDRLARVRRRRRRGAARARSRPRSPTARCSPGRRCSRRRSRRHATRTRTRSRWSLPSGLTRERVLGPRRHLGTEPVAGDPSSAGARAARTARSSRATTPGCPGSPNTGTPRTTPNASGFAGLIATWRHSSAPSRSSAAFT